MRWTTALGAALLCLTAAALACPGKHRVSHGAQLRQVAGVLPFAFSDQPGQQPPDAFLCYSDADCEVVEVRSCCPTPDPQYLAVNHAAANCIGRYHDQSPCLPDASCPPPKVPFDPVPPPPVAVCVHDRCEAVEAAAP